MREWSGRPDAAACLDATGLSAVIVQSKRARDICVCSARRVIPEAHQHRRVRIAYGPFVTTIVIPLRPSLERVLLRASHLLRISHENNEPSRSLVFEED